MEESSSLSQGNSITDGVIWKQLLTFFFPILFGTFFQQLYNTVDAIIVGQFVGKEALAAVGGSTSVLINLLVNLFVGISSGTTVVVAQKYGARKLEELSQAVHTSFALALVGGLVLGAIGFLAAPFALEAMGTPADVMDGALTYMRVIFLGTIASCIYNIGSGVLRAVGDTKRPLYFLMASCLTNIVLDLLLVVQFKMGVLGVALATVISQVVSAVLAILALVQEGVVYQLDFHKIRFTPSILRSVLNVGLPAGLQSDMYAISNIIIQFCINSFGTDTVAAWTAFGKIDGFFWMVMGAFGVSITTFVSQNYGAMKYDRVKKSIKVCLGMAFLFTVVVSTFFLVFANPLYHLFTSDANVLELGLMMMRYMAPFYWTYIFVEILSGAIRGTGNALTPMLLTCGGICVMRVLWIIFILPLRREMTTVIYSYPISWAFTSVLFIVYYLRGNWLKTKAQ